MAKYGVNRVQRTIEPPKGTQKVKRKKTPAEAGRGGSGGGEVAFNPFKVRAGEIDTRGNPC